MSSILKIDFYNGGVTVQNVDEGIIINPDVGYWIDKLGFLEVELNGEYDHFRSKHWVKQSLFNGVTSLLLELELDTAMVHDLVIPLSHFELVSVSSDTGKLNVTKGNKDKKQLKQLLSELEDLQTNILSVTVETGNIRRLRPDGTTFYQDRKRYKLGGSAITFELLNHLARVTRGDKAISKLISKIKLDMDTTSSYSSKKWKNQVQIAVLINDYLHQKQVCETKRQGFILTGKLLSIIENGFVITEYQFQNDGDKIAEYITYDNYLADLMSKRINRFNK